MRSDLAVDVELQLLGPVCVLVDGVEVPLSRQRRSLLALLALHCGRVVAVDHLIDALWNGRPPAAAIGTLQSHVSHLRRALGPASAMVVTQPPGYVLRLPPTSIDAVRFEELGSRGRALAATGDLASALREYDAALTLWRGQPLSDIAGVDFAEREAARLDEVRLAMVESRSDALVGLGRHEEVLVDLEVLVDSHPLRERLVELLILALYRANRQADALRVFERSRRRLRDDLGLEPGPALQRLQGAILRHEPELRHHPVTSTPLAVGEPERSDADRRKQPTPRTPGGNVPRPITPWFGPEALLARLAIELPDRRLVTFTGTGGIGKSRLASEVAARAADRFPDGVWLVELGAVSDAVGVEAALSSPFSAQPQPGMGVMDLVVGRLGDKRALLILDNCEHVLGPLRPVADLVVARCPHVTILATSREPLGLVGERVIPVPSLAMADAVELFTDRACAATGPIRFTANERSTVISICHRLDGIPLAIELAAARVRSLGVADILARLDDRFRLLVGGRRGGLEHHKTLDATVAWSYQLLSEPERALFEALSVFPSDFGLDAVEAVGAEEPLASHSVIDVLDSLVARSMVAANRQDGVARYRLLETLRQYARERRRKRDDVTALRGRHLHHYLGVARQAYGQSCGPDQTAGDRTFDREWDNLRAAHQWAITTADRVAASELVQLTGHHALRRYRHEHGTWAAATVEIDSAGFSPAPSDWGWMASWAVVAGDYERALHLARRGADASVGPDDPASAICSWIIASVHLVTGHAQPALPAARQAVAAAANGSDPFTHAWALSVALEAALSVDVGEAARTADRLRALARDVGAPSLLASAAYHEGQVHLHRSGSDLDAARASFHTGLAVARGVNDLFIEHLNRFGTVEAAAALRAPDCARTALDALSRFWDTRNWIGTWALLNVVAEWSASGASPELAGMIYGYLEAHEHHPWDNGRARQRLTDGISAIRQHPERSRWMAGGSTLSAEALVAYVLDQLTALAAPAPRQADTLRPVPPAPPAEQRAFSADR